MLSPGCRIQKCLCLIAHALVYGIQHQIPDLFADGASSGLTAVDHLVPIPVHEVCKRADLGALPAPVETLHGEKGAPGLRNLPGFLCRGQLQERRVQFLHSPGIHITSGRFQFLPASVAVADADRGDAHFLSALDVKLPVAHHPGQVFIRIKVIRQRAAYELGLSCVRAVFRTHDPIHPPRKPEVLRDPAGRPGRFPGGNCQIHTPRLQCAQETPDAGIDPVFKKSDFLISRPVVSDRLVRLAVRHAELVLEGIFQWRTHKPPQGLRVRLRPAHLPAGLQSTVEDTLLALGERAIQIKNHTTTHMPSSLSTPNRLPAPASFNSSDISDEITSPGTTIGMPGGYRPAETAEVLPAAFFSGTTS